MPPDEMLGPSAQAPSAAPEMLSGAPQLKFALVELTAVAVVMEPVAVAVALASLLLLVVGVVGMGMVGAAGMVTSVGFMEVGMAVVAGRGGVIVVARVRFSCALATVDVVPTAAIPVYVVVLVYALELAP